ncbi:hypothetical protein QTI66_22810 [Variovorax sp. J22R133]|uniref:hypothetical protein n=1 Tax=Variovorax brevis TaxID=3053503 RepID=UPI002577E625|nr:hypothetical protein [Variovorax sp. J22R133]MDM0114998.1 hypothetical protein [Variovorax sp. J22R133]
MALSRFAAECLVQDYLHGRTLPLFIRMAVVQLAESRLRAGETPVLCEMLCREIDDEASDRRN